ncbi:MAG TPA: hypothetical protein VK961_07095 [Chthoniobacter sp.]|jgi:hypothetical protein|nr:hypothetical protein [Chthoniobacter sp.]
MSVLGAILMIVTGLAIMAFGLFLFYAWLPLLYGLVGLDIGLLIGRAMTGDVGTLAIVLGILGAVALALASYFLEPYRRILLGVSGGFLLGLSLAAIFGLDSVFGRISGAILAVAGALAGGVLVPRYFDTFIVIASALSGAAMVISGIHLLFPGIGLFDGTSGGLLARLLTVVLGVIGVGWQYKNISKWAQSQPMRDGVPTAYRGDNG